jgi:hypothetical protein
MNTYLLFLCGEGPRNPPFAIFLQINYLQLKVHNPQFLPNISLRDEIPLPLPHVLFPFPYAWSFSLLPLVLVHSL